METSEAASRFGSGFSGRRGLALGGEQSNVFVDPEKGAGQHMKRAFSDGEAEQLRDELLRLRKIEGKALRRTWRSLY